MTGEELFMLGIWSPPILAAIWRHITAQTEQMKLVCDDPKSYNVFVTFIVFSSRTTE